MLSVLGWDIGGANLKAACLVLKDAHSTDLRVDSQPFEIWRDKDRLPEALLSLFAGVTAGAPAPVMAVTMTAELSDAFDTKRDGVLFVLSSLGKCFPGSAIYAMGLSGEFSPLREARTNPLQFAATNWLATARWIAPKVPNCLIVDVGSTTTDILPVWDGRVRVAGRTDLERLASGELVFTGVLRTNLAAIVRRVPVRGKFCRVASEYFAISGDIHLILGNIQTGEYTCSTPDGRPPSIDSARKRLARLVCADTEMLSVFEIYEMANYIYLQQIQEICDGIDQVLSRVPGLRSSPVVLLGTGSFLGEVAVRRMGLETMDFAGEWGRDRQSVVPCLAAAHLLAEQMQAGGQ
jgi:(4-(4-[2-(gamma-L-glutamylamino)ethyl]phenoxymethyl)furan-2-yl)methanamine synthase